MPPSMISTELQKAATQTSNYSGLFNMSFSSIIVGIIFSGLGLVYLRYGKVNNNISMLVCGVILMLMPFFITNTLYLFLGCGAAAVYPHLK